MTSLPAAYKNQRQAAVFQPHRNRPWPESSLIFIISTSGNPDNIFFKKSASRPGRTLIKKIGPKRNCFSFFWGRRAQKSRRPLCASLRSTKRPAAPVGNQHIKKLSSFSIRRRSSTKATIQPHRPPIKSGRPRENTVPPEAANSALTKVTARKTSALIHAPP